MVRKIRRSDMVRFGKVGACCRDDSAVLSFIDFLDWVVRGRWRQLVLQSPHSNHAVHREVAATCLTCLIAMDRWNSDP